MAAGVKVEIQHFAHRILNDSLTAVYSCVRLTNTSGSAQKVGLNINAGPMVELPLSAEPTSSTVGSMFFDLPLDAGGSTHQDFVAVATGEIADMLKVNKVVNPGFEQDSPETNTHVEWKTSGDVDASYTTGWNLTNLPNNEDLQLQSQQYMQVQVQHSGRFQLVHHGETITRSIPTKPLPVLPDGIYELRAWVRKTGGRGVPHGRQGIRRSRVVGGDYRRPIPCCDPPQY